MQGSIFPGLAGACVNTCDSRTAWLKSLFSAATKLGGDCDGNVVELICKVETRSSKVRLSKAAAGRGARCQQGPQQQGDRHPLPLPRMQKGRRQQLYGSLSNHLAAAHPGWKPPIDTCFTHNCAPDVAPASLVPEYSNDEEFRRA